MAKARREVFRPAGGKGLSIDVYWGPKFTPRLIHTWRPAVKICATIAFHIRARVRDRQKASDGGKLGPGVLSGEMWRSLTVAPVSRHGGVGARAYFARNSKAYRKNRKGQVVLKTQVVETKARAAKFRTTRSGLKLSAGKVAGTREKAMTVRNRDKALAVSGMSKNAPTTKWRNGQPVVTYGPQKTASGGHSPISILQPSSSEADAVGTCILLAIGGRAMETKDKPKIPMKGDRALIQKIRRSLGL